jgi:hypothetical protein
LEAIMNPLLTARPGRLNHPLDVGPATALKSVYNYGMIDDNTYATAGPGI